MAKTVLTPGTVEWLTEVFTYHPPTPEQTKSYEALRAGAAVFAALIVHHAPASPDRSTALRAVREAVLWANASIALGGRT